MPTLHTRQRLALHRGFTEREDGAPEAGHAASGIGADDEVEVNWAWWLPVVIPMAVVPLVALAAAYFDEIYALVRGWLS